MNIQSLHHSQVFRRGGETRYLFSKEGREKEVVLIKTEADTEARQDLYYASFTNTVKFKVTSGAFTGRYGYLFLEEK